MWFAIIAIYLIDFSINAGEYSQSNFRGIDILRDIAVQAVDRALLVDTIPSSEQASGNAWAARMLGIGSVLGFFLWVFFVYFLSLIYPSSTSGYIKLPHSLPFLGNSQLQVLSVIASLILLAGHLSMAVLVKERVLVQDSPASK